MRHHHGGYSKVGGDIEMNNPNQNQSKIKKFASTMSTGMKTVKMVFPYFWPKGQTGLRIRVIICLILLVLGKVVNLFVPLMYQRVVDALPESVPLLYMLMYGFLRWLSNNIKDVRDSIFVNVENYATRSVALDTFRHLHDLSLGFHLTRNTGALLRTMDRGKSAMTTLLSILGFTILPTLLEVLMTCGVLLVSFGAWYSVITFFTIAGYIAFTLAVTEWRTKYRRAMNDTDNEASNTALDSLLNYETVKYFTAEEHEINRYDKSLLSYFEVSVKSQWSLAFLNVGQIAIVTAGLTGSMILSAYQVHNGKLTLGELVAINAYIIQLYIPLSWLGTSYRMIINSFTDMEKLFDLLNEKSQVIDLPGARPLQVTGSCEIEFKNVSFTYPRRGESSDNSSVIRDISFKIPAGHTVAVVGQSGSGKTTLSRLLCRFYEVNDGMILVNGQDISKFTQLSLRNLIGVVPQDTVLFNDTLRYNIGYGAISKKSTEIKMTIEQAAQEANIHNFIISTPDRYDTKVGERGLRLSGGEKQRVAIARTILKDPSILILDEATSALDSRTEREIQSSLMQVSKGRTTLIVAHRLSTIVNANQILVLKNGQIVERGTHRELLEIGGEYKAMWEIQARESDENSPKEILI